jgi:hypothetical protein
MCVYVYGYKKCIVPLVRNRKGKYAICDKKAFVETQY